MADEAVVVIPEQQTPAINPEMAKMMEIHLNGGIEPKAAEATAQNTPAAIPAAIPDIFTPFKEKFGYENPEAAIKEIEELRNYKANPVREEIKFENDDSKKLFAAIQRGDRKEVYSILSQQERLDSLTTTEISETNAAEVIKLGMSLKYKDLTPAEIDYKFNKQYAIPKEPVQALAESDEDFATRKTEWQSQVDDVKMTKIIDAKLSRPELESAKSKIVLPEFPDTVDQEYIQWKKDIEEQSKGQSEISEAYKAFTPKDIEKRIKFTDEANKIDFEFQYEPEAESFTKSVDMGIDMNKFFALFQNQDGTPDRKGFLAALHFAANSEKILMEAMKQAKNATIKSFLPDNSGGVVRQLPQTQELSELDKHMKAAGII